MTLLPVYKCRRCGDIIRHKQVTGEKQLVPWMKDKFAGILNNGDVLEYPICRTYPDNNLINNNAEEMSMHKCSRPVESYGICDLIGYDKIK